MPENTMSAAMKRAGVNINQSALYIAAVEALRDRSIGEALRVFTKRLAEKPALLDALALPFLRDVQNDIKNSPGQTADETQIAVAGRGRGQVVDDTQSSSAAPGNSGDQLLRDTQTTSVAGDGGQTAGETQSMSAAAHPLPARSPAQRDAAKRAASAEVEALDPIFKSRRIGRTYVGNLKWYELQEIARDQSWTAARMLERGQIATENFFLCVRLSKTAIPADHDALVHDVVNAKKFTAIFKAAKLDAARFIAEQEKRHVHSMLSFDRIEDQPNA